MPSRTVGTIFFNIEVVGLKKKANYFDNQNIYTKNNSEMMSNGNNNRTKGSKRSPIRPRGL